MTTKVVSLYTDCDKKHMKEYQSHKFLLMVGEHTPKEDSSDIDMIISFILFNEL